MKLMRLCECGCGDPVQRLGNRFLYHHHRKGKSPTKEHRRRISESLQGRKLSEAHCKRISENQTGRKLSKEHCEKISEGLKGHVTSEETKRKISQAQVGRPQTEQRIKNAAEGVRRFWKEDPRADEVRRQVSERSKKYRHSKLAKAKISHSKIGKPRSEETKRKVSATKTGVKLSMETRRNMSLAHGGDGTLKPQPYPTMFNKALKDKIKTRDSNKCRNPGCWGTTKRISVHHIDYDKDNCDPSNLITVCQSCNVRANKGREFWTAFYQKLMKGRKSGQEEVVVNE